MNLPSFYTLSHAWYFLLMVPVIVFYFLKLKRLRCSIPSLVLWQKVMRDSRVNAPFQRFKKHILLLLQLLVLAGVITAAMQPFIQSSSRKREYIPVLVDVSASMNARTDKGRTPLEQAKERIFSMINSLLPGQQMCIVVYDCSAEKITPFTDNIRILKNAAASLSAREVEGDIEEGLHLLQGLSQSVPFSRVHLFTDGNVRSRINMDLPFFVDYHRISGTEPNMGITALTAKLGAGDTWSILTAVQGSSDCSETGILEIFRNSQKIGSEVFEMNSGNKQRFLFTVSGKEESRITARIETETSDSLDCDNKAFLSLPEYRDIHVFAETSLPLFRKVLNGISGVTLYPRKDGDPGLYDLLISDRCADSGTVAKTAMYVGVIPEVLKDILSIEKGSDEVIDWAKHAPLLEYVSFHDMLLGQKSIALSEMYEPAVEQLGYTVLVYGSKGPLLLRQREGGRFEYYLLFKPGLSTFPFRIGFPVMLKNLVGIARARAGLGRVEGRKTGILPDIACPSIDPVTVSGPNGSKVVYRPGDNRMISGVRARAAGLYTFKGKTDIIAETGASLLSSLETGLKSVEELQVADEVTVSAIKKAIHRDKPLWLWIAGAAMLLFLVEWWFFHRRPF